MSSSPTKPGFLLLLSALATLLLALIIAPFAGALFAAAVFAGVFHPVQVRVAGLLGDRPRLAAGLLTFGITAIVVVPLSLLSLYAADQIAGVYRQIETTLRRDGVDGIVEQVPGPLRGMTRRVGELLLGDRAGAEGGEGSSSPEATGDPGVVQLTGGDLETAAGIATNVLDTLASLLVDLGVLIVAFFFLMSQGDRLVKWIRDVLPLSKDQSNKMVREFRDVTRGVFVATIATAFVQTVIASIGYLISGVAYLPALILITFCAALIPVVGGAIIVVVVGALLLLSGDTSYGVFLILWGVVPVGLSDNLMKPWMAQGALRLPGSVVLFAMIGGLAVFGPMGIVAGPLIVAFFLTSLRLLKQEGVVEG